MQVLVLVVAVMIQLAAGQDDPFAMFNTNTNSMSSGTQDIFGQPAQPDNSAPNTFGQAPPANTPNQFGQPQPNGQQPPTPTQFGQLNQFGQQPPAQNVGQPTNQFPTNGNNPTMSFQQPQQGTFGQPQNTFGNQPNNNMNQIGGQPGNVNSFGNNGMNPGMGMNQGNGMNPGMGMNQGMGVNQGMGMNQGMGVNQGMGMNQGNNQPQLTPDQAFLVGGQWNQQQQQQNNGRTMFSSFDPNNPTPFQPQGQQNSFGNGQFGGTQQFGGPQNPNQNFMTLGTSGNDLNTFRDNNLPVGEVDNIRFGIGPNQQPFRMDVGTMNFGQAQQQGPAVPANNFSPFAPFTTGGVDQAGFGGMQGGMMGGMPGPVMGGMPMGVMPGGFGGGFGGPEMQGFGSFLPPPPQPSGGIFSRLFGGGGGGGGGGFFSSLFGKKK